MKISQTSEMAIRGLWELAEAGESNRLMVADIARRHGVSESYLAKIFNRLRHAGLVESRRGKIGGFHLARSAEAISLGEVIRLFDGAPTPTDDPPAPADDGKRAILQTVLRRAERRFFHPLDETSVADLRRTADSSAAASAMLTPEATETT